ncbi:alpha/beta hydrolase [Skermania sp. ID1734]|uniref:alpha/beta fold hydrolase n=1 Tax=Skermania sp. ID1734 TaxID=2597516 RepID=UPI001180B462|nr:alpha/beta hydrolase [Skermania sp. ID1734]TSD94607.1 alpha/beta hydrolase [Skermania sp. ID1734]
MNDLIYNRRGDGPPLVLIHGIGSRWQVWEPVLDRLAQRYDVIAVDLPGFGASPVDPSVRIGVDGYADRIATFMADLGLEGAHVVGNSMGGGIAIELGRRGVAGQVTAFSPVGFWSPLERKYGQSFFRVARSSLRRMRGSLPKVVATRAGRIALAGVLFGHPTRLDPEVLLDDVNGLLDAPSFDEALKAFDHYDIRDPHQDWGMLPQIPVTVAWGTRDALLISRTQSARARRAMPFARHVSLPTSGHVPFNDDPVRCVEVVG